MRRLFLFLSVYVLSCFLSIAQNSISVLFYNTENLFDTSDDPSKNDESFTPEGDHRWTNKRYRAKLDAIARVIVAADEDSAPVLVGLCEVENDTVMTDLTERSLLRNVGYRYVMTSSPDSRGIDVALMYRRNYFQLIGYESIGVSLESYGSSGTRDILHVTGRLENMDTLDLYVCHWPSRLGGTEQTEPMRLTAAAMVRCSVDSIFKVRRKPYVIIMGDLNEGPDDSAVRTGLSAYPRPQGSGLDDRELVTVMDDMEQGSYKYEGIWDNYDQFVVSASMLNGLGCTEMTGVEVFAPDFLLEDDDSYGGVKPMRTYNGMRYKSGYSDHLPIIMRLTY